MRSEPHLVDELLSSDEPSICWRTRVAVLKEPRESPRIVRLEQRIRRSPRVTKLLAGADEASRRHYAKWKGSHWALASLADLGYPMGDPKLGRYATELLNLWLGAYYHIRVPTRTERSGRRRVGIPIIAGRARAHASQQGNALRSLTRLELGGERRTELAELLLEWQWPDGGWNCDRSPTADTSSFMETLLPMRGLAAYGERTGVRRFRASAERAAEVFLQRHLFRRRSNGRIIRPDFLRLHFPRYWHYDVLGGLVGLGEAGRIHDARASDALDWLESRQLPSGGWAADARYYRVASRLRSGAESVDWGGSDRLQRNDWVTVDALSVLREAGRLSV